jgi:muramoyltetrapeptide carboxypeptidase
LGLEPVLFPSARARAGYLAGSDAERLTDLQAAFDDPDIDAVWALRGGYGTLRILDRLDLDRQRRDPIPFIGFSDNTTLHVRHAAMNVVSFHGPHPGGGFVPESEFLFHKLLFSEEPTGLLSTRESDPPVRTLVPGVAEGPIFGGNLAILASLCGSRETPVAHGRLLFLEDVGEPAYRVDRLLVQLRRAGTFDGVAGLACGRFTETPEGDGDDVLRLVEELAHELGVPAVADLPIGHVEYNWFLPVGTPGRLDATSGSLALTAPAVRIVSG